MDGFRNSAPGLIIEFGYALIASTKLQLNFANNLWLCLVAFLVQANWNPCCSIGRSFCLQIFDIVSSNHESVSDLESLNLRNNDRAWVIEDILFLCFVMMSFKDDGSVFLQSDVIRAELLSSSGILNWTDFRACCGFANSDVRLLGRVLHTGECVNLDILSRRSLFNLPVCDVGNESTYVMLV